MAPDPYEDVISAMNPGPALPICRAGLLPTICLVVLKRLGCDRDRRQAESGPTQLNWPKNVWTTAGASARPKTDMKQIVGVAFLVVGIILLCLAWNSYHSAASTVSRALTGASTDRTIWLGVGGGLGTLIGLGGLLAGSKKV
jgi:hypothetical protein